MQKTIAAYQKLNATPITVDASQALKAQMALYHGMIKDADDAYKLTADKLGSQVQLHQISYDQETAALLSALDTRYKAEQAVFIAELALAQKGTAEYQRILNTENAADDKYLLERQKATEKAAEEDAKQWKAAADQVAGAFNSQLKGLLAGTTSWSQAMKNISADLVLKFIQNQVKATAEFLASKASELTTHVATETAKTTATTAGSAVRTAMELASGKVSIFEVIGERAEIDLRLSAGQTAAEVSAAVAPEAGPAAPAIGLAAGGAIIAGATGIFASADVGTDYVVRSGLAVIHQGEKIIPVGESRDRYTGAGMGGTVHAPVAPNISALDSRSVERFFHDNAKHMIRAINNGIKSGAHLGLRGARADRSETP